MSLIDRKVSEWTKSVSSLDDKPQMTAADLKAAFDSNTNQLKSTINGIIDDLTSTDAVKNIGVQVDGLTGVTVFDVFANIVAKFADRYTKTETDSQITTNTKDLVKSIAFDEDTGIFTITKKDNSQTQIDTALEKVPAKFELITEGTSVLLRITNIDGSTTQTDVTALMSGYTFNQSDSIAFSLSGTGNNKTVTATIRQAGVTKDMLASDASSYLEQLETLSAEHKYYAEQSAENAQNSALQAQNSAQNAIESQQASKISEDNAAQSAADADASAQTAKQFSGKPPIINYDNWHTWNADTHTYTDTGFPARGEKGDKGDKGEKGDKGDTGHGLIILGYYDTIENLKSAQTAPNTGDAYGIGTAAPYNIYVWDGIGLNWVDNGQLQGPKGEQGIQGEQGIKGDKGEQGIQGEKGDAGQDGLNATINGVNTLEIIEGENITLSQVDSQLSISAKGSAGKRVSRFTVGTSTNGWTANDCDYLCDGTDDQVEINNAINALPDTGGEVIILDGTYNITAEIAMSENITLSGNGNGTKLLRIWDSNTAEGVISIRSSLGGCHVQNLYVDGNMTNYTSSNNIGIYILSPNNTVKGNICKNNYAGIGLNSSKSNNIITGNICNNNNLGISIQISSNNTIACNICNDNSEGIHLYLSSDNTVTGNSCKNNNDYGIYLYSTPNSTITGNSCNKNNEGICLNSSSDNTVTGNTCKNNNSSGIYLYLSSNNAITGNSCNSNGSGIALYSSSNNSITGNTFIRGSGLASDYTPSQDTIYCSGNNNLIVSNNIMGKNYTDIGSGNTWANNKYQ